MHVLEDMLLVHVNIWRVEKLSRMIRCSEVPCAVEIAFLVYKSMDKY